MDGENRSGAALSTGWFIRKATLFGVGGLLTCAGVLIGAVAVTSAAREWVSQMDKAPGDVAVDLVKKLSAATSAGAGEWQKHSASSR